MKIKTQLLLALLFCVSTGMAPAQTATPATADPQPPLAVDLVTSGNAKEKKRDYDGAIADYTKAIELDPAYTKAYNGRGNAKDEKGDHDSAITDYTKAIDINPNYGDAYYNRGIAKEGKGAHDDAIADYTKAIQLDSNHADAYCLRGIAKEKKGDFSGAIADYRTATQLDRANIATYGQLVTRASLASNKLVVDAEAKACEEDPKFGADIKSPMPDGSPPKSYDLITATYTSGSPDRDSQTQVIQRHRFVDGKYVKTEKIYSVTEYGRAGIQTTGQNGPIIWRGRYLVSYADLDILDMWTGKKKFFGHEAPPPNHLFNVVSVSPEELVVANVHTTARDIKTAMADMRLFSLREPNGKLAPLPNEKKPFWPVLPSLSALSRSWEISPDGNRRAMHPLPGEKPAPEEGLWLYDKQKAEKKFLEGSFIDPSKTNGSSSMAWLDNERFVTFRPDGEIVVVHWDGTVESLGTSPNVWLAAGFYRDGQGQIFCRTQQSGDYFLADANTKNVVKVESLPLSHDWEISLPLGPNTPVELRHAGKAIIKTKTSGGLPEVSPDGLNVAMADYDKPQGYLRVYSLATKEWVDFPSTERPIAWVPAPDVK